MASFGNPPPALRTRELRSGRPSHLVVRRVEPSDEEQWRRLWQGYCQFYEVVVPEEASTATWRRIVDPDGQMGALVAADASGVVGFANYVLHPFTWSDRPACLLEDLFVDPSARGRGAGTLLIESMQELAARQGCARLYWLTRADNDRARRIYDRIVTADGFVRYVLPLQATDGGQT